MRYIVARGSLLCDAAILFCQKVYKQDFEVQHFAAMLKRERIAPDFPIIA